MNVAKNGLAFDRRNRIVTSLVGADGGSGKADKGEYDFPQRVRLASIFIDFMLMAKKTSDGDDGVDTRFKVEQNRRNKRPKLRNRAEVESFQPIPNTWKPETWRHVRNDHVITIEDFIFC